MKKFVYGALALTAIGATGQASDSGWSGLDQEINSLSASLAAQNASGPKIGGWVHTSLRYEADRPEFITDTDSTTPGNQNGASDTNDTLGFQFDSIRIELAGDAGNDYSYKVTFDLLSGSASLRDAYVDWKIADGVKGRLGRYKLPFVRSALMADNKLLFNERTFIGELLKRRDLGAMVSGKFETVSFQASAQNGVDGIDNNMLWAVRGTVDLMGDGVAMQEGAYGAGNEMDLQVGGAFGSESSNPDSSLWALEGALTSGPLSVHAEVAGFDEGLGTSQFSTRLFSAAGSDVVYAGNDSTPWDATVSYMFTDKYEAAVRYEDLDDTADTTSIAGVINRYVQGHDIKWQVQYRKITTDYEVPGSPVDFNRDELALGLTVSF